MQTKSRFYLFFLILTLLLLAIFTFLLSYSWSPGEDEVPRRSRPVLQFCSVIPADRILTFVTGAGVTGIEL